MTLLQLLLQTTVTFAAASLGAIFGAFLTRRTERFKHLQELRSAAYADFVRGVATAAEQSKARNPTGEGIALVADARARIAIYGGGEVVHALSEFIARGAQTCNPPRCAQKLAVSTCLPRKLPDFSLASVLYSKGKVIIP